MNKNEDCLYTAADFAKLLRLYYEIGREDALAGVACTRDIEQDAGALVQKKIFTMRSLPSCYYTSGCAGDTGCPGASADGDDEPIDSCKRCPHCTINSRRARCEMSADNDAGIARITAERDAALNDLEECAADAGTLCGYCAYDGRCPIPDDEMDSAWPDRYEWRGDRCEPELEEI